MTSDDTALNLLRRYHAAMLDFDAEAFADLYAPDAVHEFPFRTPGGVDRLQGRDQIRQYYRKLWAEPPVILDGIDDIGVHRTDDPHLIINEWSGLARPRSGDAEFRIGGVIVLSEREGALSWVRDYMDTLGLAAGTGGLSALTARFG